MRITNEQQVQLLELLILMKVPLEERLEIAAALGKTEFLIPFLDILSERNFDMTPEEVYQALIDAVLGFQSA